MAVDEKRLETAEIRIEFASTYRDTSPVVATVFGLAAARRYVAAHFKWLNLQDFFYIDVEKNAVISWWRVAAAK